MKKGKFKKNRLFLIVVMLAFLVHADLQAQCSMCRAALESEADNATAEGINQGIVYLMAVPYILVGGLIYIIYRKMKS